MLVFLCRSLFVPGTCLTIQDTFLALYSQSRYDSFHACTFETMAQMFEAQTCAGQVVECKRTLSILMMLHSKGSDELSQVCDIEYIKSLRTEPCVKADAIQCYAVMLLAHWASACDAGLEMSVGFADKIEEMVVCRHRQELEEALPSEAPVLTRVGTMKILGVTLSEYLSQDTHVNNLCIKARQSTFASSALVAFGLKALKRYSNCIHSGTKSTNLICCSRLVGLHRSGGT